MKSRWRRVAASTAKTPGICFAVLALLVSALVPLRAEATPELDRKYGLETVGHLKAWDNVDFLFSDYVSEAYDEYFAKQSRFKLQDIDRANELLTKSKIPYLKVIEDNEILGQLSRAMRVETILRTKVLKEGPRYRFTIQWLHAPKMDLLAEDSFTLDEPRGGQAMGVENLKARIQESLQRIIGKIPFKGAVSGRDGSNVTLSIGRKDGVNRGDAVTIATLDDVKRHPLLKTVVEWRLTPIGRVEIDDVDDSMAFGRIVDEAEDRQIARYQKVTQIIPLSKEARQPVVQTSEQELEEMYERPPRIGFGKANVWVGTFSRDFSTSTSGNDGRRGSGILIGSDVGAQVWMTRNWFVDLGFGFGTAGYSQTDLATGAATGANNGGITLFQYGASAGYTYYTTPSLFGPKAWAKLGYRSRKYSMSILAAELQAPIAFGGLYVGIGGELPLRGKYGAALDLDFGVLGSVAETGGTAGSFGSANDVQFFVGGYYRAESRMTVRAGINISTNSADLTAGGAVTHRIISIGPSLLYYF